MRSTPSLQEPRLKPVIEELTSFIDKGKWGVGQRLPAIRHLASQYSISFNAARDAIGRLEELGLVKRIHGSGTYVRERGGKVAEQDVATQALACLFMDSRTAIFGDLAHLIESGLNEHRLVTIKAVSNTPTNDPREDPRTDHVLQYLRQHTPRAVIAHGLNEYLERELSLCCPPSTRIVTMFRHPQFDVPGWHSVNPDTRTAFRMATQSLLDDGHRRIGLVTKSRQIRPRWKHTFRKSWMWHTEHILAVGHTLRDAGIDHGLSIHYTQSLNVPEEVDVQRMAEWLRRPDRPTAVIAEDFRIAAIEQAAEMAGLRVPADLALFSVGGWGRQVKRGIPHVSLQYDLIARHVVDLTVASDEQLGGAARHVVVPPTLVAPDTPRSIGSNGE